MFALLVKLVAVAALAVHQPHMHLTAATASPGHPQLAICFFNRSGRCVGGAGWQFQTGDRDQCDAPLLWSQVYAREVSVWIDDSAPNRDQLTQCEQQSGRPAYHVFIGLYGLGQQPQSFGENMAEWYPFHNGQNVAPQSLYGCPTTGAHVNGFFAQQNFGWEQNVPPYLPDSDEGGADTDNDWSGDPPTPAESAQEWRDALTCIPAGATEPMGSY